MQMTKKKFILLSGIVIFFSCTLSFAQSRDAYIEHLKQRAKNGSATEQYILGREYIQGNFTNNNLSRGLTWLKRAAKNKYLPAMLFLGKIYEIGIGTAKNYQKAARWYKKASEQGSQSAAIKLAPILEKNPEEEFIIHGLSLQKANKFSIRYTFQDQGAKFLPEESSDLCDRFRTNKLQPGSDQMQACYTRENKLAYLEFRFPNTLQSSKQIQNKFGQLKNKYGEPEKPEEDKPLYIWRSKGVKIDFWYNAKYSSTFLRYSLPQKEKQFLKQKNSSSAK